MVRLLNRTTFSTYVLRIDPILYHIVYVQSFLDATSLHYAIQSRGSFDFFIRHVKVLVYVQSFSDSHTSTILSATPSLTTLIYNAHQRWDPPELQHFLDNSPDLRRLHIASSQSSLWHIHHSNITHFSIEMWSSIPRLRECLPSLPSLTHLSLSMVSMWDLPYRWQFARGLPDALSVFLLQFTRFLVYDPQDGPHDPRVVCVSLNADYEPYVTGQSTEGIMCVRGVYVDTEPLEGKEDAWSLAERIIQDRLNECRSRQSV